MLDSRHGTCLLNVGDTVIRPRETGTDTTDSHAIDKVRSAVITTVV